MHLIILNVSSCNNASFLNFHCLIQVENSTGREMKRKLTRNTHFIIIIIVIILMCRCNTMVKTYMKLLVVDSWQHYNIIANISIKLQLKLEVVYEDVHLNRFFCVFYRFYCNHHCFFLLNPMIVLIFLF